ncbi:MAG: hypothetical protein MJ087_07300 [Lachnospiraceae bacterium]|nr:hypothetical protein [Lachnospiraceae bacterium]
MKTYVKPDVYYEDFELSTHVATCALDMPESKKVEECYAEFDKDSEMAGDYKLFANSGICEIEWQDYCYHTGTSDWNIFNS